MTYASVMISLLVLQNVVQMHCALPCVTTRLKATTSIWTSIVFWAIACFVTKYGTQPSLQFSILELTNHLPSSKYVAVIICIIYLTVAQLTGHENVAMRWILSRLNATIVEINNAMKVFDLGSATAAAHRFWFAFSFPINLM